jgi:hypothetical protein
MPMTPSEYAARYLPLRVPTDGPDQTVPINISRYRLSTGAGDPQEREKENLISALSGHLAANQKQDKNYFLQVYINGEALEIKNTKDLGLHAYRPFLGKGSPEECSLVLQLAVLTNYKRSVELQAWADKNLGLDCNGFVGNYVFHEWMDNDWFVEPPMDNKANALNGPSADIETLFHLASGPHEERALDDLDKVSSHDTYLVARVEPSGSVIAGSSAIAGSLPGHIAITEPGQIQRRFMSDSLGVCNRDFAGLDMCDHLALRTVESAGPTNGVGSNWIVVVAQHTRIPKMVLVNRDKAELRIANGDKVKIAPLLCPGLLNGPNGKRC